MNIDVVVFFVFAVAAMSAICAWFEWDDGRSYHRRELSRSQRDSIERQVTKWERVQREEQKAQQHERARILAENAPPPTAEQSVELMRAKLFPPPEKL